jgi:hypothetical protein
MESNETLDALSGALNKQANEQLKDKRYMKTILISLSKNSISTPSNMESLNLIGCIVMALYFVSRTILFHEQTFLFWTGIISSLLWLSQFAYSWVGYKKLSALDLGQDPIIKSIEKISALLNHYQLQKKIYIWAAPLTILTAIPIPFFEFRKINFTDFFNNSQGLIFISVVLILSIALAIFLTNKFWKDKFSTPLKNAIQNLKELAE